MAVWAGRCRQRTILHPRPGRNLQSKSRVSCSEPFVNVNDALDLLDRFRPKMVSPTYASLLQHCDSLEEGKRIHSHLVKNRNELDVFLGNHLVNMYGKCGALTEAWAVFAIMPLRNIFSWNIIIGAYIQNGQGGKAFFLYKQMLLEGVVPDKVTFVSLLTTITNHAALPQGKQIHSCVAASGLEVDVIVGTALVNMYGKCKSLEVARKMFNRMPERNVISWSAMIGAYAQNEQGNEALQLFHQMELRGLVPKKITFVSVLSACACQAALAVGKDIHDRIRNSGFEADTIVGTALVNMYGKCGSLVHARTMFDKMDCRNLLSWTAMIEAYALHGQGKQALDLFQQMQLKGVVPDKVTFFSILSACSHLGLLEEGCFLFESMGRDHGITPALEHFNCMIDLLGRMGRLDEGESLINSMPFQPSGCSLMSLLAACKVCVDVDRAKRAAECVFMLDPENTAPYVLLSNIYATSGRSAAAHKVLTILEDKGFKRWPGCSSIEINNRVHEFLVDGVLHPQKEVVHFYVDKVTRQLNDAGCVSDTKTPFHNISEKEYMHRHHTEKLACTFGLISTEPMSRLGIVKSILVCPDCDSCLKSISKNYHREFVVRHANCFQQFNQGMCLRVYYW